MKYKVGDLLEYKAATVPLLMVTQVYEEHFVVTCTRFAKSWAYTYKESDKHFRKLQ